MRVAAQQLRLLWVSPGPVDCLGTRARSLLLHPQIRTCHWRLTPLTQCARCCRGCCGAEDARLVPETVPGKRNKVELTGDYSITSSARVMRLGGTGRPSVLAVL